MIKIREFFIHISRHSSVCTDYIIMYVVEAPKELDSIGAFGFTAKSQNMSYAVIGLLVVVAGYLFFKRCLK